MRRLRDLDSKARQFVFAARLNQGSHFSHSVGDCGAGGCSRSRFALASRSRSRSELLRRRLGGGFDGGRGAFRRADPDARVDQRCRDERIKRRFLAGRFENFSDDR
ncbi:hypothetical protein [Caballeronia grimmiae]|uniref:Uncharacterized protein n=1 Tax=Caballeronia grimmiae TaxID=1071679 RepID=A0A069NG93_9BURK|nr:hypothetical protein [Caballeronia grimmiae]KDR26694.1 hypothetical protein BG57_25990 [Caballeronia grimmiae]GGD96757.1 hypothetical protein GCM10010985_59320 [Caballeronia grimmiae]